MQAPIDTLARRQQEIAEQAAAGERARVANVNRFVEMYLTLGPDATKLDGSGHDAELAEAKAIAAARWFNLFGAEAQIQREEAALASRPKKRPIQPGDDLLPDRTLEQQGRAWEDETKHRRDSLATLKDQAKTERKQLESFQAKGR
jgi:hypothetical protein